MVNPNGSTLNIDVAWTECSTCGTPFGMSKLYFDHRRADGRPLHCPNGHPNVFPKPTPPGPSLEHRQELVAALHRAEQAEAAAADRMPRRRQSGTPRPH